MADSKITQLTATTTLLTTDIFPLVVDPAGTPVTKKITMATLAMFLGSAINFQRGQLINGKIVPSVASNNLTVAIKGLDGNDPSATNPVYCRIGDTIRSITAALSVTKNAGTNWCNAGGAELATKEVDYFVYLGYNATDGVVVGFSRYPGASEYDDFSATSTNEKYCAISTITNAAAGDDYEVIGRFAATLSAGAGYTWTVPTFTNKNLVQRPIRDTRWLSFAPQPSGGGSMTVSISSTEVAEYQVNFQTARFRVHLLCTTGGSANPEIQYTLPWTPLNSANYKLAGGAYCYDANEMAGFYEYITSKISHRKYDNSNWAVTTNRRVASDITSSI